MKSAEFWFYSFFQIKLVQYLSSTFSWDKMVTNGEEQWIIAMDFIWRPKQNCSRVCLFLKLADLRFLHFWQIKLLRHLSSIINFGVEQEKMVANKKEKLVLFNSMDFMDFSPLAFAPPTTKHIRILLKINLLTTLIKVTLLICFYLVL